MCYVYLLFDKVREHYADCDQCQKQSEAAHFQKHQAAFVIIQTTWKWWSVSIECRQKQHNLIEWFCLVKSISLPVDFCNGGDWYMEWWHQEPTEFVRQNFTCRPPTPDLPRELLIVLLQATSESVWEASWMSFQEESSLQLLRDQQTGLEEIRFWTCVQICEVWRELTCHWNKSSRWKLQVYDLQSQWWRYHYPRSNWIWNLEWLKQSTRTISSVPCKLSVYILKDHHIVFGEENVIKRERSVLTDFLVCLNKLNNQILFSLHDWLTE